MSLQLWKRLPSAQFNFLAIDKKFWCGTSKPVVAASYDVAVTLTERFMPPISKSDATRPAAVASIAGGLTIRMQKCSRSVTRRMILDFPAVNRRHGNEDICQQAAVRLQKPHPATDLKSRRHLESLAALRICRPLLELAKSFRSTLDQGVPQWAPVCRGGDLDDRLNRRGSPEPDTDSLELWACLMSVCARCRLK